MGKKTIACLLTAVAYILIGYFLYRQRVVSSGQVWESDLLVFVAPFVAAFLAFLLILLPRRSTSSSGPKMFAVLLALLATCASAFVYTFLAFNRYGT